MATAAQIEAETWWDREIISDPLDVACDLMALGLGIARSKIGTKGNTAHLRGSHRSQEWIKNSAFCTSRTYTVQSGLTTYQARCVAGVDITPGVWGTDANRRAVAAMTARVIAAMKAGQLPEVREVYGAAPDLRTVTGYNNPEDRPASSDDSHLDHMHLGIDRRVVDKAAAMLKIAHVVIGDVYMDAEQAAKVIRGKLTLDNMLFFWIRGAVDNRDPLLIETYGAELVDTLPPGNRQLAAELAAVKAAVKAGGLDPAVITAAVKAGVDAALDGLDARIARIAVDAVRADLAD